MGVGEEHPSLGQVDRCGGYGTAGDLPRQPTQSLRSSMAIKSMFTLSEAPKQTETQTHKKNKRKKEGIRITIIRKKEG